MSGGGRGGSLGVKSGVGSSDDRDGGRSLMDEINALFAPPGRGSDKSLGSVTTVELHPYYRRPGKGHNHDCCDACGEGGDLICCDNCPASFHLSCHAPPLEDSDLPIKGDWVCLRCHYKEITRNGTIKLAAKLESLRTSTPPPSLARTSEDSGSKESNGGEKDSTSANSSSNEMDTSENVPALTRSTRTRPTRAAANAASRKAAIEDKEKVEKEKEKAQREKQMKIFRNKYNNYLAARPTTNSPFDALIAAVQVSNAEEFGLPKNLETKETLPFSWKWADERQDDFDAYPKNCQNCHETSRGVPALGCDFCGNVYHLDCLDPPLCEIPKERWMCPTHVEHYLDANVVQSTSLSKRLKMWNKYAKGPVDTDAVKIEFFRKIKSGMRGGDRLYTKRQKLPRTNRVVVPEYIKTHYKNPLPVFPLEGGIPPDLPRDYSEDEWAATLISLQTSVLRHQSNERKLERTSSSSSSAKKDKSDINGDKSTKGDNSDSDETTSNCSLNLNDEDSDDVLDEDTRHVLNEYIGKNHKRGIDRLCPLVKEFLALQKMKDIFPDKPIDLKSEVRARASLVPLNVSKVPSLMRYRTLDIGLGPGYGLDLSQYGHCNFVTPKTATIFFDQYSRVYELINYSEHGIIVDNLVYALDVKSPPPLSKSKLAAAAASKAAEKSSKPVMSAYSSKKPCHCQISIVNFMKNKRKEYLNASSSPSKTGSTSETNTGDSNNKFNINCENSAVLHHGSYLRFGCIQFVFSVLEFSDMAEISGPPSTSGNPDKNGTKDKTKSISK